MILKARCPRLSSRGKSGDKIVKDYIITYCKPRSLPNRDVKIRIKDVTELPLRMILFIIARLASNLTLHVASRSYTPYGIECLEPILFNWSEGVLVNLKEQLTKEKEGKLNKFGYGVILVSFSLERVPLLQPQ